MSIVSFAEALFEVDGTPADCVKLALTAVYKDWRPEILVSGYVQIHNHDEPMVMLIL